MNTATLPTRQRILAAADEIATQDGAAMMSLDAVAARAGVSKGGLLYHFPSKGKLLQALVENHLAAFEAQLNAGKDQDRPNGVILAVIDHFLEHWPKHQPTGGLLAALADDPAILSPIARFQARILQRIRQNATDPALAEMVFFAMQAWRNGRLLGTHVPPDAQLFALLANFRLRLKSD